MQRALRTAIVVAGIVLGALLARRALRGASDPDPAAPPADLFSYRADRAAAPGPRGTPARLGGTLDLAVDDLERACEGEAEAIRRMTDAMGARLAERPDDSALQDEIAALPTLCFEPPSPSGPCRWATDEIEHAGPLAAVAWRMAAHCPSGIAAPLFDRPDAPADAVLELVASREPGSPWLRPPPRLPSQYARAVLELAGRPELAPTATGTEPGLQLRYDDPAATEILLHAYESAPEPAQRRAVARGLALLSDPRARAAARSDCASAPALGACAAPGVLDAWELLADAASAAERRPAERPRIVGRLEACARGNTTELVGMPSTCLAQLATLDWARARALAPDLEAGSDPGLERFSAVLERFPSPEALTLALRTRQLLGTPRASDGAPLTVPSVMAAHGRAWVLGPSAFARFGHDVLLRHLLRLADIAGVEVDERDAPAPAGLMGMFVHPTTLRAITEGHAFEATTASDGDYFDLDAVVAVANVVARARGADVRFLVVVDPLAEEAIALGPRAALASAVADGLLEIPSEEAGPSNLPF